MLGIGDRHNDNIMVSRSGHLFHIDFGHFLGLSPFHLFLSLFSFALFCFVFLILKTGKLKYWAGIKRERAPFIFTPDFAYVLGGKDSAAFARFVQLCCRSYNILRHHSHLFINLFAMMLSTSIPELQTADDITYLRRAFVMDLDDARATEAFTSMMYLIHPSAHLSLSPTPLIFLSLSSRSHNSPLPPLSLPPSPSLSSLPL